MPPQPDQIQKPEGQSPLPNDVNLPPVSVQASPKTRFTPKRLLLGLAALLVVAAVAGWGIFQAVNSSKPKPQPASLYQGKIRIGTTSWPGNLGYYIADSKGYFKQAGLDVEIKNYSSLAEPERDYLAGKLQGRANLTLDALKEALGGLDQKIVLAGDYSSGADGIIARPPIKGVSQLKGQKVAYEQTPLEEVFLRYALEQYNLTLADIVPVNLDPEKAAQAFADGQVPASVTYEPYMSTALQKVGTVVFSSKEAPGLITDVLTFHTAFVNQYPDSLNAILQAYFRGLQFWKDHPDEGNAIVAKALGETPDNIAKQLKGITMLDERDNRTAFTFAAGLDSLYGNLRQLASLISADTQPNSGQFDTDKLIEPRFIEALSR